MNSVDSSSEMSDADPMEMIEKMKNIDELDEALFGSTNIMKSSKMVLRGPKVSSNEKKVTFQEPVGSRPTQEEKKTNSSNNWLFDDDDDGILGDTSKRAEDDQNEERNARSTIRSLMKPYMSDADLKKSGQVIKTLKLEDFSISTAEASNQNTHGSDGRDSDKKDKLHMEEPRTPFSIVGASSNRALTDMDEIGFGSYKPTLVPPSDSKRIASRQSSADTGTPIAMKSLTQVLESPDSKSSSAELEFEILSTPTPVHENPRGRRKSLEKSSASTVLTHAAPSHANSPDASQNIPSLTKHTPPRSNDFKADNSTVVKENQQTSAKVQLHHTNALLQNMEQSYKRDLEVTKSTYDNQLEILRSSHNDLKVRMDRELESIRECYSSRVTVLRRAMQAQIQAESTKECDYQDEIKRLRNLHLEALEETRMDMDARVRRLRDVHAIEIESLRSATSDKRNMELMMKKVDTSAENLHQLSFKYESAYKAMTQQSESITLSNKQLVSVVQNQLTQQQRSTSDLHMQVQQTVSRLEGLVSEMNRKFEEQHYAVQASHNILQSAHTALQDERTKFLQQITLEREHLRKAHRELITTQSTFQQNLRDDHSKLLQEAKHLTSLAESHEEAREKAAEKEARRNRQYEEAMDLLNLEKIEYAKKDAKLEAKSEKLITQHAYLREELMKFNKEKTVLQKIQVELEKKQLEIDEIAQKRRENESDMEKVHVESRRFEEERNQKLAEIQHDAKELRKQRQLLTEERHALAQERMSGVSTSLLSSPHPTSSFIANYKEKLATTPIRERIASHPGSPDLGASPDLLLWRHSAKKDQSFLEDEQFFLETVGSSPYGKI